jgi:hypothetical protein
MAAPPLAIRNVRRVNRAIFHASSFGCDGSFPSLDLILFRLGRNSLAPALAKLAAPRCGKLGDELGMFGGEVVGFAAVDGQVVQFPGIALGGDDLPIAAA